MGVVPYPRDQPLASKRNLFSVKTQTGAVQPPVMPNYLQKHLVPFSETVLNHDPELKAVSAEPFLEDWSPELRAEAVPSPGFDTILWIPMIGGPLVILVFAWYGAF